VHNAQTPVVTTYAYLNSGLLKHKRRGNERTDYQYDNLFRLKSTSLRDTVRNTTISQSYTYDKWDRVVSIQDNLEQGKVFITSHQYDQLGRVKKEIYPSGYFITNHYDSYGNLINIMDSNKDSIWTVKEITAKGQILKTKKGNKETNYVYDDRGFPTRIHASGIMDMNYGFTEQGNLDFRKDGLTGYEEHFGYDDFNRLSEWHIIHERKGILDSYRMDYTPGKTTIRSKSGYGSNLSYGINGTKPHALASFQPESGQTLNPLQHITYTDFKKVKRLSTFEGTTYLDITYGVDEQRIKSVLSKPNSTVTRYYLGSYEEEIVNGNTRKIHYLSAGDGLAAIYVQNSNTQDSLYYAYTDYQGSLIAVTDKVGNLREHYAYDAWGLRRNPSDWTQKDTRTAFLFTRGYTFHEHIPEFNLINMNGRMYDPGAGLFFSPDPYIQAPGDWLNYNRYTYCLNNPLIYTDPDGEFIHLIIGGLIGGVMNWAFNGFQFNAKGLSYFGVGALAGALGAGIGAGISSVLPVAGQTSGGFAAGFLGTSAATTATSSFVSGALIGAGAGLGSGFTTGFGNSLVGGDSFGTALGQGALYGLIGGASGGLIGGIAGGVSATRDGRRFWDGATVKKEILAEQNIPIVGQRGDQNCLLAGAESVDKSFGGNMTQEDIRNLPGLGGNPNTDALGDGHVWSTYSKASGHGWNFEDRMASPSTKLSNALSNMQKGNRIALNLYVGEGKGHTAIMQRIVQQTVTKINGSVSQKLLYYVMDPAYGGKI
ncbi:RHS repeat-associated core domain-containing protein, partial [Bacteroidales bacterium OttesenSCG-928-M06]|nr:RHS repeat-associated core domain-containing protein [Bacteroidales bacterium OttesenSCG-928-M06]